MGNGTSNSAIHSLLLYFNKYHIKCLTLLVHSGNICTRSTEANPQGVKQMEKIRHEATGKESYGYIRAILIDKRDLAIEMVEKFETFYETEAYYMFSDGNGKEEAVPKSKYILSSIAMVERGVK